MSINLYKSKINHHRFIERYIFTALLFMCCSLFYSSAHAESCWISGGNLSFGTVNAQGSSTVSTNIAVTCNPNYNDKVITYRICLAIDSTDPSGNDPRRMVIYNPQQYLNYYLYYDAALTQVIPDSNNKNNIICQTMQLQPSQQQTKQILVYGKVLSGQNVSAGYYKTNSIALKLFHAYREGSEPPSDIEALANQSAGTNNMVINANYENSCLIVSATDIDFGTVDRLTAPRYQSGTIQLACPTGTNWKVSLDNGINASGTQRRMKNAQGSYLDYALYQDASRSILWQGNTQYSFSNQTIPVYGAIPAQDINSVGQYSDTITVTLTY